MEHVYWRAALRAKGERPPPDDRTFRRGINMSADCRTTRVSVTVIVLGYTAHACKHIIAAISSAADKEKKLIGAVKGDAI